MDKRVVITIFALNILAISYSHTNDSIDKLSSPQNMESLWEQIKNQREELEESSKKENKPLREILNQNEFKEKFPFLPQGQKIDSVMMSKNIELRIATIPRNIHRDGKPYSIVAIIYHDSKDGKINIIPDTPTSRQILNLTSNWDFAKKVSDFPKIIEK